MTKIQIEIQAMRWPDAFGHRMAKDDLEQFGLWYNLDFKNYVFKQTSQTVQIR